MAMKKATGIREKEAAIFVKESGNLKTNHGAVKRIGALEAEASGDFLQTEFASVLKNLTENDTKMLDIDHQDLKSSLSGSTSG